MLKFRTETHQKFKKIHRCTTYIYIQTFSHVQTGCIHTLAQMLFKYIVPVMLFSWLLLRLFPFHSFLAYANFRFICWFLTDIYMCMYKVVLLTQHLAHFTHSLTHSTLDIFTEKCVFVAHNSPKCAGSGSVIGCEIK